mgnify:CR=1 FL=1
MSTTSRVLPWRRQQASVTEELVPLITAYKRRHPKGGTSKIAAAYEMARAAHQHQSRMSGELYISHPLAVAKIVADIVTTPPNVIERVKTTLGVTEDSSIQ